MNYSPEGQPTFIYDRQAPEVDVVRSQGGELLFRFSESVNIGSAEKSIQVKKGNVSITGSIQVEDQGEVVRFKPGVAFTSGE